MNTSRVLQTNQDKNTCRAKQLTLLMASPQGEVKVNKQIVSAMFDSGANISSISRRLSKTMKQQILPWIGGDCVKCDGSTHRPSHLMKGNDIEFNGTNVKMNLAVIENLRPEVILGIDFMVLADVLNFGPSLHIATSNAPELEEVIRINLDEKKMESETHEAVPPNEELKVKELQISDSNEVIVENVDNTFSEFCNEAEAANPKVSVIETTVSRDCDCRPEAMREPIVLGKKSKSKITETEVEAKKPDVSESKVNKFFNECDAENEEYFGDNEAEPTVNVVNRREEYSGSFSMRSRVFCNEIGVPKQRNRNYVSEAKVK